MTRNSGCAGPWVGLLLWAVTVGAALASPPWLGDAVTQLEAATPPHRVLVLGELHGTHEAPALAAALVAKRAAAGRPVTLALEISTDEQARIDAFLDSTGDAGARAALLAGAFWQVPAERSDGRRSTATLALIEAARRARQAGGDVRLLAFDAGSAGGGADQRNVRMAAMLREAITAVPWRDLVVLIGNYHARRAAPESVGGLPPGMSPPVPTMAHLADLPLVSVNVGGRRGEFWACIGGACGAQPVGRRGVLLALPEGMAEDAVLVRPTPGDRTGWDMQVVLPTLSVAPPATTGAR
jgi:hypothetical protein